MALPKRTTKQKCERALRKGACYLLPQPLLYELWHYWSRRNRRPNYDTAANNQTIRPQEGVVLEIYWSDVPGVGYGPSASLFVLREEVLRLDCFGDGNGHMHFNPSQVHVFGWDSISRVRFSPISVWQQIERGAFELTQNAAAAIAMNMLARVRKFPLEQSALDTAANEMTERMRALCEQKMSALGR